MPALEAELKRRLALPLDQWERVGGAAEAVAGAYAYLDDIDRKG